MGDSFTTEAFTLLSLAIVVIILRIVARILTVGFHNFQLDDYLMPLAGVCPVTPLLTSIDIY